MPLQEGTDELFDQSNEVPVFSVASREFSVIEKQAETHEEGTVL